MSTYLYCIGLLMAYALFVHHGKPNPGAGRILARTLVVVFWPLSVPLMIVLDLVGALDQFKQEHSIRE